VEERVIILAEVERASTLIMFVVEKCIKPTEREDSRFKVASEKWLSYLHIWLQPAVTEISSISLGVAHSVYLTGLDSEV